MRSALFVGMTVGLLVGCPASTLAQEEARAIIAKGIKALGGEEKIDQVKAWRSKSKGTLSAGGAPFTQEVFVQLPQQFKEVFRLEALNHTVTTIWTGEGGWLDVNGDIKPLEGTTLAQIKEASYASGVLRLTPLKDQMYELSLLEESQIDSRPAVGVQVTAKGHQAMRLYFDKENGLPVKTIREIIEQNTKKTITDERFLSRYEEHGGRKWPTKVTVHRDGKKFMDLEVVDIQVVDKFEASVFAKPVRLARPQEPKKPYPYLEEEVSYENKQAGVKFAGTLTLPRSQGPFPAVLLITGSGPQDRDETVFGHRPFLILADYLTRRGIAVLRVDDRGVGGSTGSNADATSEDFVSDTLAGVAFLKGRKEINPKQIGLIGHSEGGMIGPMAAVKSKDVAFLVLLAGPGLPGKDVLVLQGQAILKAKGAAESILAFQRTLQQRMFAVVQEEKENAAAEKKLRQVIAEETAKLSEEDRKALGDVKASAEGQIQTVLSPWFRFFLTFDPRPTLRQVRCPVLALNGEKDVQVDAKENLAAIDKALKDGGNKDVTVKALPELNHLFQTCQTGGLAEYSKIEETFAPAALEVIGDWIVRQTGTR
jgi:pimeloyl-ACP methyl ester carboxylesterase